MKLQRLPGYGGKFLSFFFSELHVEAHDAKKYVNNQLHGLFQEVVSAALEFLQLCCLGR